jgi:cysteine sulfinate desulfinase/cysteine desulfurase-like protein
LPGTSSTARRGVGALYLRKGTHILAQQQGGSQERYRRAGTEDVAGAVAYLADADFVTGTTLFVDGGRSLQTGFPPGP